MVLIVAPTESPSVTCQATAGMSEIPISVDLVV